MAAGTLAIFVLKFYHEHDHHQRRHGNLLQGLGHRPAGRVQVLTAGRESGATTEARKWNENKREDHYEGLVRTLSAGQGKSDCQVAAQQLDATGQAPDKSVKRYEHLVNAAKAFIFTVIVKDGRAVCTIHYPGVLQVTGYTEEEYAAQPLLWCSMIYAEDKEIVFQQIARLLRSETPPPIKHRIKHKNGSIRWLRNTSVPVFDLQGKLIAYDGLIVDISKIEFATAEQEHQISELTSALGMVKTLHSLLPICSSCKKIRDDKGYWQQIDAYIAGHFSAISFTHGMCPVCAKRLYPQYYDDMMGVTPKRIKKLEAEGGPLDKTPPAATTNTPTTSLPPTSIRKIPITIYDVPVSVGLHPIASN